MPKGQRIKRLARAVLSLVLIAAIGHLTAATVTVEAAPGPSHQDILNSVEAVQTTVDQIPPAWSQILPALDRFQLVMGGAAVLDKETGLVWEKSPATALRIWGTAQSNCNTKTVGGRLGWRLPTLQELASLVDSTQSDPALPSGHPFSISIEESPFYWSATTDASNASTAWVVSFGNGFVISNDKTIHASHVWCVRGGQGVDPQ
ncbi:MAG: DUF1566 domain-containing protein [Candidatus Methylomirabilaceae bacterium]